MFAQKPVLQAHVAAARLHNYYLMRRISAKFKRGSPVKYHFFHPATLEDALGPIRQLRRNLELTRIDADAGMICQAFVPRNHIRLCLHFQGIVCQISGKRMFVIDPRYTLLKEQEALKAGVSRHPERHQEIIRRLEAWVAQQASVIAPRSISRSRT